MEYQFESLGPALRIVVLLFLLLFAVFLLALVVLLAALPGLLAKKNGHPQAWAVNICGWLGLPTGILWVVAMVWAVWDYSGNSSSDVDSQLTALEAAVDKLEAKIGGAN